MSEHNPWREESTEASPELQALKDFRADIAEPDQVAHDRIRAAIEALTQPPTDE